MFEFFARFSRKRFSDVDFEVLDKFPARSAQYDYFPLGDLYIIDNERPREVLLEPFHSAIFLKCLGIQPTYKILLQMRKEHKKVNKKEKIKENFKEFETRFFETFHDLVKRDIIRLHSAPKVLPYYMEMAMSRLDTKEAIALMRRDGIIPPLP